MAITYPWLLNPSILDTKLFKSTIMVENIRAT
uniref:Uncharacterized protein n=1 Tax=Rhizophora mucronata TaxID=61149 RepID=A0A2P2NXZ2_RHIMU